MLGSEPAVPFNFGVFGCVESGFSVFLFKWFLVVCLGGWVSVFSPQVKLRAGDLRAAQFRIVMFPCWFFNGIHHWVLSRNLEQLEAFSARGFHGHLASGTKAATSPVKIVIGPLVAVGESSVLPRFADYPNPVDLIQLRGSLSQA